jgi:hypothetical protein
VQSAALGVVSAHSGHNRIRTRVCSSWTVEQTRAPHMCPELLGQLMKQTVPAVILVTRSFHASQGG